MTSGGFHDIAATGVEAGSALSRYGERWRVVRLLGHRENAVFEVRSGRGRRAVLRIHRSGYQSESSIRSEVAWVRHLGSRGIAAPVPIAAADGRFVVETRSGAFASMLAWVAGRPIGVSAAGPSRSAAALRRLWRSVGSELARIHNACDSFDAPPDFRRPAWDVDGFLGEAPVWGRFWEHPALAADEAALMRSVRSAARSDLSAFRNEGADFGLIHADPLCENILLDNGRPAIIDYDDGGFGFRMYDLAVFLFRHGRAAGGAFGEDVVAGYRQHRALPDSHWRRLRLFLLLRSFACLGWIVPRMDVPGGPARSRNYVASAVNAARRYIAARGMHDDY